MNVDVEGLLRSGMERFTDEVQAPRGLAERAARVRRRRITVRVATAASTAAVTAAAVIAATGTAGGTPAPTGASLAHARAAAYVISRVENALAGKNKVIRTKYTFSPAFPAIVQWNYRGNLRSVQSGFMWLKGSPWAQGQERWVDGTATINGKRTYVEVDSRHHEWYPTSAFLVVPNACASGLDLAEFNPANWTTYIRQTLSCGKLTIAGHALVNGKKTIKLTGSMTEPSWWTHGGHHAALRVDATLYVDPSTYLPVRAFWSNRSHPADGKPLHGTVRQDVRWLPPTPRNVARASVTIPAGFRKVPDGSFGGPVFQLVK